MCNKFITSVCGKNYVMWICDQQINQPPIWELKGATQKNRRNYQSRKTEPDTVIERGMTRTLKDLVLQISLKVLIRYGQNQTFHPMAIKKFYLLIIRKERAKTGEDKKKKRDRETYNRNK